MSLDKSQEFNLFKKINKNDNNLNNSTYVQEFKLKKKFHDITKHNSINSLNKILVKKRPINENIITHHNLIENKYTGFYICKKNKGENILNLPINANNLDLINQFLKESGFQISQINSNKFPPKENDNQKNHIELNFDINNSNKKKKFNPNIKINKFSNKKEKTSAILGLNKVNKIKKLDNNKIKNYQIKLNKNNQQDNYKTKINLNNNQNIIKNTNKFYCNNKAQERILVRLNGNIEEEFEKNYQNKKNINNYKKEDEIPKIIKVTTPYFRFNDNNSGK